jgi:hypothetical protein
MSVDTASATLYRRLFRQGQRLEIAQQPNSTPHEYTASLNAHIGSLASPDRWQPNWQEQIQAAQEESWTVLNLYTRTIYSSQAPDREAVHQAIQAWNKLRRRLWLVRVLSRWQNQEDKTPIQTPPG